jgi:SAM-dependent methyltransferase
MEGVGNILRFNWHFYLLAAGVAALALWGMKFFPGVAGWLAGAVLLGTVGTSLVSLLVSWWVYDLSGLYGLKWLEALGLNGTGLLVNVHAGFDETSRLLENRFPKAMLRVLDFYDPATHTEVSIRRARRAVAPFPGTVTVRTTSLPLPDASADAVLLILAAHEIRDDAERAAFFRELRRVLKPAGTILVVEHLRDAANFLAYNVGAFHFLSRPTWLRTFGQAGLSLTRETTITPFITAFWLENHETAS